MQRGELWWASLPLPVGSGPGFRRPVLVIQADSFNASGIRTAIVAVVTSNLALADAPGNVRLSSRISGLPHDSVVNVSQVLTIDRRTMTDFVRSVPARKMEEIDRGLRLALDL